MTTSNVVQSLLINGFLLLCPHITSWPVSIQVCLFVFKNFDNKKEIDFG